MKRGKWEIRSDTGILSDGKLEHRWWWVYKAANGEVVCVSETYTTEAAARKGIAAVKRGVLNPVVVELP